MTPLALARAVAKLTLTKKASEVVMMDLRGLTSMADFFVVCSADSDIQVNAIARAVEDGMKEEGVAPWHSEKGSGNWVLLDYVDVVLHIFHRNARQFYSLDKLWGDARITGVEEETKAPKAKKHVARKPAARKPAKRKTTRKKSSS